MKRYKLGDICEIVSGSTPKTGISEYWDGDVKWITPAELNDDSYIINDSVRKITELGVQKTGLSPFPAGTVILSSRAPIGKVAIAGCEMYCNQGFKNLICSEKINNKYLYWFLRGNTGYLNSLGRGATFKEISKKIVASIELSVPGLHQQEEIVRQLEKVNDIIRLRRQELQKLDNLIKARFIEMFGDMLLNSMNWSEVRLDEIADIVSGITKGRKIKEQELFEVPYMAVSNVKDGYIDWTTVKTIMASQTEIDKYQLKPFDVLMTEGGDPDKVGRGAIIHVTPENCIHQNHIFRVRLNRDILLPEYMEQYLQQQKAKRYFLGCAKQTTGIASINMRQLTGLPVLVPKMQLQEEYVDFVHQVDKSKVAVQKALDEAQTLFDSLMQEYFG